MKNGKKIKLTKNLMPKYQAQPPAPPKKIATHEQVIKDFVAAWNKKMDEHDDYYSIPESFVEDYLSDKIK